MFFEQDLNTRAAPVAHLLGAPLGSNHGRVSHHKKIHKTNVIGFSKSLNIQKKQ